MLYRVPSWQAFLIGELFLFLTGEKALHVFRTVFPIGFRPSLQESITDLSHAAPFAVGNSFKILLQVGMNPKCEPSIFFHPRRIVPPF
jgi:hypothetical protein